VGFAPPPANATARSTASDEPLRSQLEDRESTNRAMRDTLTNVQRHLDDARTECTELQAENQTLNAAVTAGQRQANGAPAPCTCKFDVQRLEQQLADLRGEHAASLQSAATAAAQRHAELLQKNRLLEADAAVMGTERDVAIAKMEAVRVALDAERKDSLSQMAFMTDKCDALHRMMLTDASRSGEEMAAVAKRAAIATAGIPPPTRHSAAMASAATSPAFFRTPIHRSPAKPPQASPPKPTAAPHYQQISDASDPITTMSLPLPAAKNEAESPKREVVHHKLVRDKNAATRVAGGHQEVATLEQELFETRMKRDEIDTAFRRIEHDRVRTMADKARREALQRELKELNLKTSCILKRLRDISALER
jgi:hypothetical protein